ncbi:MAG: trypsin-like serine peptidase [Methylocella sp.]
MKHTKHKSLLLLLGSVAVTCAATESVLAGGLTTASAAQSGMATVDFVNAKPMPLPISPVAPNIAEHAKSPAVAFGAAGFSAGGKGTGIQHPVFHGKSAFTAHGVASDQYGTGGIPFTTARVKGYGNNAQIYYPFRAAGKLFFNVSGGSAWCSAGLIKPGVIVTAAHCVADFGKSKFYSDWVFEPAFVNDIAPYGSYTGLKAMVLTSYFNGTDSCAVSGIVCQDDVAVILLNQSEGKYPGTLTGWFSYGWNGYSFNSSSQTLVAQLGYPAALDSGQVMERTDSQGETDPSSSNNTIIGSLQTGGSSGGPWVANLGSPPVLSGISNGTGAASNTIVGVTSWGYIDTAVKEQGASPFTTTNITVLVNDVCTGAPAGAC